MNQKIERRIVVEEGDPVKLRVGRSIDDGVDNRIVKVRFKVSGKEDVVKVKVDVKDIGGGEKGGNVGGVKVKVIGEVGVVAEETENVWVNTAVASEDDGVQEGGVVDKEKDEVSVVKEEVIVNFVHIVLVDEVVEEGVTGEEFEDIGCRAVDAGVDLDDAVFGTVLGEDIGEVGGDKGKVCCDIAKKIGLRVAGRVGEAVADIREGRVKEGGVLGEVCGVDKVGNDVRILGKKEEDVRVFVDHLIHKVG
jgi:hypothetical protein